MPAALPSSRWINGSCLKIALPYMPYYNINTPNSNTKISADSPLETPSVDVVFGVINDGNRIIQCLTSSEPFECQATAIGRRQEIHEGFPQGMSTVGCVVQRI